VGLLGRLEPFHLACIEQPLGDEDLAGHAELARHIRVPICLDESLTSLGAVALALDMGACSVVNIKAGRVGGYLEAVRVHDLCAQRQVPTWCGGMVETGIARAFNVALASLPNFSLPGDLSATGRFFETDLTSPLPLQPGGTIAVPDGPGTGVTVDSDVVSSFSTWRRWCPVAG
jgi:o-succinylbenzoate synthase